ncbi:MAG: 6-O-methylguanine DNA methyltransferase, partial [Anaerolineae bacterium]|nr:6-O-methylguanine DNA methyltransferase [Anaerolineae bacterium]
QRVINSQGKISLAGETGEKQKALLEAEGVIFTESGRVNFAAVGWNGPDEDWLAANDLDAPAPLGSTRPQQKRLF